MNLSESYKKRLGELAGLNESKDWVDKTSNYGNLKDLLDNFGASDWSYKVFEADKFHKFCPLGFDLEFDKNKKEVILYVCTRNEVEYRAFWETVEQEFSTEFLGYNTAE